MTVFGMKSGISCHLEQYIIFKDKMKYIITTLIFFMLSVQAFASIDHILGNEEIVYTTREITKAQVRKIFFGHQRTMNGVKIKLIFLPFDSAITRAFSKNVLGMSPKQLEDKLVSLYAQGEINKPLVIDNEKRAYIKMSKIEGGIGYLSEKWMVTIEEDGIKAIHILEE